MYICQNVCDQCVTDTHLYNRMISYCSQTSGWSLNKDAAI